MGTLLTEGSLCIENTLDLARSYKGLAQNTVCLNSLASILIFIAFLVLLLVILWPHYIYWQLFMYPQQAKIWIWGRTRGYLSCWDLLTSLDIIRHSESLIFLRMLGVYFSLELNRFLFMRETVNDGQLAWLHVPATANKTMNMAEQMSLLPGMECSGSMPGRAAAVLYGSSTSDALRSRIFVRLTLSAPLSDFAKSWTLYFVPFAFLIMMQHMDKLLKSSVHDFINSIHEIIYF